MSAGGARRGRGSRGAVLVETALVVGVILTMLLFSIQVGVLGFLQLTLDAASFVDARLGAVGVADTAPNAHANSTHAIFPQVLPGQIVTTVAPAPSPSVPVDYGYNSPNAATQAASATHRNGGVSMMEPTLQTSTITKPSVLSLFGKRVGAASQSVDALWLECGIHENVSNSNAGCSPAAGTNFQGSYFTNGENAPPYFVGLNHIHHCLDAQPWTTCSVAGTDFLAIGTAEFLHAPAGWQGYGNWGNGQPGVGGTSRVSTFSLMGCHQRSFAVVAATLALPQNQTLYGYYNATSIFAAESGYGSIPNAEAIYYQMYKLDGSYGYYVTSQIGMNSFANGPPGISNWVINWDDSTNHAIGGIYAWDTIVPPNSTAGTVGTNQNHPDAWCP